jgi:pimeloyl-ACP methyl ester carboxylesterase
MNNPKQNFFLTKNNQKIHYKFINNKSLTTIIFLHGLMSNIKSKKAKHLKKFANENKINLLLFEYSGHGRSSGKFTDFSIKIG